MMMPKVCRVVLKGALKPWVTAKDIILEVLRRLSVKGGVGKIIEYAGDGIKTLTVPERQPLPTWERSLAPPLQFSRAMRLQGSF